MNYACMYACMPAFSWYFMWRITPTILLMFTYDMGMFFQQQMIPEFPQGGEVLVTF